MTEFDGPWKEIFDEYLEAFLVFSLPDIHAGVDWLHPVDTKEQELRSIFPPGEAGNRIVDKLFRVRMREGIFQWLLLHIEVQSDRVTDFGERMFICFYRIADRYQEPVVCIGVLGDESPSWRPSGFQKDVFGCRVDFVFPIVKLLDYADKLDELERSENPFAIVVLTHLMTKRTSDSPGSRHRWKVRIVRGLFERGKSADEIRKLFRFIDWMMDLPDEWELEFRKELIAIEQESKMPYITSIERIAKEQGIAEGKAEGKIQLLQTLQELLGQPIGSVEELSKRSAVELAHETAQLQALIRSRMNT